ncbi:hypothetical protein [Treponema sp.]|uniref:hypothetical protein n=1 Tax=Treponema sp. TaxID=166 RepID=UPI0025EBF085|nr:hypothetical protein [Treponema sp.]
MRLMKLKSFLENKSLRWRIMVCVTVALILMGTMLLSMIRLTFNSVETLGDSYKSNSEINNFSLQLAEAEKAMETYVSYHTFESIDAYYSNRYKIDEYIQTMQKRPSTDEVRQKEYIVYQFSRSFISYSMKAVAARRGNNTEDLNYYYKKTLDCYNMLLSQLLELNKLLLQQNAANYEKNHDRILSST